MKKVIIIGAGILGAATAYELAKAKIDVTIIDNHISGRATSAAAGIICPWITKRRNKAWYVLAANGAKHYESLIPELENLEETNTGYKKVGMIRLHEDLSKLEELKEIAIKRRTDSPQIGMVKILNQDETKEMFPPLEDKFYSLFVEGAARVDGNELREALIRSAMYYGATYIDSKAKLLYQDNHITGVQIDGKALESDIVIATNGVWMNELLAPLQVDLHFQAQKGEIIHLQMDHLITDDLPVVHPPNNQYILNFEKGRVVIGATHESTSEFEPNLSAKGVHYILEEGLKMAPGLGEASIIETRVGFRPFTYNHLPIFGAVPDTKGLLIANGLGASGLTTGPYIAKQLACLVLNKEPDIDINPYKIELGKH